VAVENEPNPRELQVVGHPFQAFGDAANWPLYWGAGGGAGSHYDATSVFRLKGGAGGSNGAKGVMAAATTATSIAGGAGGGTGGGAGGTGSSAAGSTTAGANASSYGGGGGGGGSRYVSTTDYTYRNGGAGYQGLVIIRIPYS
jgi:hypothetical protein